VKHDIVSHDEWIRVRKALMSWEKQHTKERDAEIYLTYQLFGRGGEDFMGIYRLFDMLPLGREEHGPTHGLTDWAKLRNRYDDDRRAEASGAIATKS
jgi:predicted dithiol-disulfide oxidoreductase (DUF899 family)